MQTMNRIASMYRLSSNHFQLSESSVFLPRGYHNYQFTREDFYAQYHSTLTPKSAFRSNPTTPNRIDYKPTTNPLKGRYRKDRAKSCCKLVQNKQLKFKLLDDSVKMMERRREKARTENKINKLKIFWAKQNSRMKNRINQLSHVSEQSLRKTSPVYTPIQQLNTLAQKAFTVWSTTTSMDWSQNFLNLKIMSLSTFEPEIKSLFLKEGKLIENEIPIERFSSFLHNLRNSYSPKKEKEIVNKLECFVVKVQGMQRIWLSEVVNLQINEYKKDLKMLHGMKISIDKQHLIIQQSLCGKKKSFLKSGSEDKKRIESRVDNFERKRKQRIRSRMFDMIAQQLNTT